MLADSLTVFAVDCYCFGYGKILPPGRSGGSGGYASIKLFVSRNSLLMRAAGAVFEGIALRMFQGIEIQINVQFVPS